MSSKTVWVRGRPLRGALFGLLMGLGVFLLLTKFALIPIDTAPMAGTVLMGAVVGLVRAMIGRPYRVTLTEEVTQAVTEP